LSDILALIVVLVSSVDSELSSDFEGAGVADSVASDVGVGVVAASSVSVDAVAHPARTKVETISVLISATFFGIVCLSNLWLA
jgi:hypothetical protein